MRKLFFAPILVLMVALCACSNDPNKTRQQAASATEELKRDSREAAGDIKKGADTARTELTAAAQGVKEGLNDTRSSQVNVNTASKSELMGLSGIDERRADAIIANRPYQAPHDVVKKGAISEDKYQRIASHLSTHASK